MKTMKKMLRSFLALILVFGCLSCGMVVHAAGKIKLAPQNLWVGTKENWLVYQNAPEEFRDEAELVSIKSSNTKVIKIVRWKHQEKTDVEYGYTLTAVKAGSSKITVTYKYKGKKTTISATYTVKKNPKPFASITIAGKKLNLKKNPYKASLKVDENKVKQIKVKVKFNKGWKLKRMYRMDGEEKMTVKNGKFDYTGEDRLHIVAVNKKKVTLDYSVDIFSPDIDPESFG